MGYRPPWYALHFIGIAGPSGSGKTSLARAIVDKLNVPWVSVISMDCFYKVLSPEESELAFKNEYDFDSPNAYDWDLMYSILTDLKKG